MQFTNSTDSQNVPNMNTTSIDPIPLGCNGGGGGGGVKEALNGENT